MEAPRQLWGPTLLGLGGHQGDGQVARPRSLQLTAHLPTSLSGPAPLWLQGPAIVLLGLPGGLRAAQHRLTCY